MNKTTTENCLYVRAPKLELTQEVLFTAITTATLNIFLALVACVGNGGVILAYCKTRTLRTNANFLLICLALTDLLVGMLVQPLFAATEISLLIHESVNCVVIVTFTTTRVLCAILSVMTVLVISCERYVTLFWPLRYHHFVTFRRIAITIGLAWLVWTLVVASRFMGLPTKVFRITCSLVIIASHLTTGVVYLRILRLTKRHVKDIKLQGQSEWNSTQKRSCIKEHRALKTTLCVTGCLVLCYTPLVCLLIAVISTGPLTPELDHQLFAWADTLVFLNSSLNPCIYCWRNSEFRRAVFSCFETPRVTLDAGSTRAIDARDETHMSACSGLHVTTESWSKAAAGETLKPKAQLTAYRANVRDSG